MTAPAAQPEKAVVLLSGGLDSATALAMARDRGYQTYTLAFRYGQRHLHELEAAERVARHLGSCRHRVMDIDLGAWGGSALTGDVEVPKGGLAGTGEIPVTYVPARNIIFLSLGLAWAEVLGARSIFIGANALDYSGYPDCRPEFIEAFQRLVDVGTKAGTEGRGPRIEAPLINMTKAEIIRTGTGLGVDYSMTHSCYDPRPDGAACGHCDSCLLRKKGFKEAGISDPTVYA
jgi:7-cyano-7-deazaguanine synthase